MTAQQQSGLLAEYKLLEECILSGQVSERDLAEMTATDPQFAEWLRTPASERQSKRPQVAKQSEHPSPVASTPEHADLIALAAWLHRRGKQAIAAADATVEEHRTRFREEAGRFDRAADIVKEAADRQRRERATTPSPEAANQA